MKEKVVLVSGHFNVIHPGHLRLFRFAKDCGTRLVVAVESDQLAGDAAHVPEQLRLEGVRTNSYVDEAFLFSHPVSRLIDEMRPAVVVKGKEHETRENPEAQVLSSYGGELLFSSGETIFSSLDLIRQELDGLVANTISLPFDFMKRHGINSRDLSQICGSFGKLRVLVIGDLIIDEYITCQPLGLSQEEPSIVVTPIDTLRFVGGAGIVAAHAAGLGADVDFISVTGRDDGRDFSIEKLRDYTVRAYLLEDASRPTTIKQRYRSQGNHFCGFLIFTRVLFRPIYKKKFLRK